ncbi:hypothetical protein [Tenacibaculum xiamenense]|uniref:hypothetical protein n=1 Tax=Tenacibaculum xiamenense TaxID=1261553 RepID=UPI0038B4FE23
MKLNELKNLGKELSKNELINVAGGDVIVGYMCADGLTGSVRGNDVNEALDSACHGHGGGFITFVKAGKPYDS